jgi:hypothetical protein
MVETMIYTGNGADDRSIGGLGMSPEYVMVAGFHSHVFGRSAVHRFGTMSGDSTYSTSSTGDSQTNRIQALLSDGFQA